MNSTLNYMRELNNKHIILGVAFDWGYRKGLDMFIQLSKSLSNTSYKIVLVGTDNEIDRQLPKEIISIHRTQDQYELAKLYAMADVFVIPTREDNYPTVNLESIACGTPVVTFKTGGSPEMLDQKTGIVVSKNDITSLVKAIKDICENRKCNDKQYFAIYSRKFDMNQKFAEYVDLYSRILEDYK